MMEWPRRNGSGVSTRGYKHGAPDGALIHQENYPIVNDMLCQELANYNL